MRVGWAWQIFYKRPYRLCIIGITIWPFLSSIVLADISPYRCVEAISPPSNIEPIAKVEHAGENPVIIDSNQDGKIKNEFREDFYLAYLNDLIAKALESGRSIRELREEIEKLRWAREVCGLDCESKVSEKEDGFYIKYVKDSKGTVGILHYFLKEIHAATKSFSVLPLDTGKTIYYEPVSEKSYEDIQKHVVSVAFSTDGGCEKHIMEAIGVADNRIDIAIYNFDNKRILDTLFAAGKKGKIAVRIMVDKSSMKKIKKMIGNDKLKDREAIMHFKERGIKLKVDQRKDGLMHNKFMVVDDKLVITGSYNWTEHSNSNRENTVMLSYITAFQEYFDWLWDGKTRSPPTTGPPPFGITALFSPRGGCYDEVTRLIAEAAAVKKAHPERPQNIDIALFYFTDKRIAETLFAAKEAGVNIRIVLDKGQKKLSYGIEKHLLSLETNVREKRRENPGRGSLTIRYYRIEGGLMHDKFAVIGRNTLTGSFNWSKRADDKNRENLVVMAFPVKAYAGEFERLWEDYESQTVIAEAGSNNQFARAPPSYQDNTPACGPPAKRQDGYWQYTPESATYENSFENWKTKSEEFADDSKNQYRVLEKDDPIAEKFIDSMTKNEKEAFEGEISVCIARKNLWARRYFDSNIADTKKSKPEGGWLIWKNLYNSPPAFIQKYLYLFDGKGNNYNNAERRIKAMMKENTVFARGVIRNGHTYQIFIPRKNINTQTLFFKDTVESWEWRN